MQSLAKMPESIEILCQIHYAAKQGYVRLRDALPRISQAIIFNVLVSRLLIRQLLRNLSCLASIKLCIEHMVK